MFGLHFAHQFLFTYVNSKQHVGKVSSNEKNKKQILPCLQKSNERFNKIQKRSTCVVINFCEIKGRGDKELLVLNKAGPKRLILQRPNHNWSYKDLIMRKRMCHALSNVFRQKNQNHMREKIKLQHSQIVSCL